MIGSALLAALLPVFGGAFQLTVDAQHNLVDELGRTRIFHGMNVVYKAPPYVPIIDRFDPQYSFSAEDVLLLRQWGANAIRLAVMWPGVEPTRGVYNHTYLALMKNITAMCEAAGIAVLLEMHQDVFSEKFCGEGVPLWAAQPSNSSAAFPEPLKAPYQIDSRGVPLPSECAKDGWSNYYFTAALGSAVQALYSNTDGLLDSFAAYWQLIASEFKTFTNIIGIEIMNEPWSGDAVKDPALMIPGVADRINLQPVYERVAAAIRAVAPALPVFFESVTWDDVLVGFTQPPGGELWKNKSVLAYHWYRPPNFSPTQTLETRRNEAARLGCGWFCSESDGMEFFETADGFLQSWLRWEYKNFVPMTGSNPGYWFENGTVNAAMVFNLTRTYAYAIGGSPDAMSYDPTSARFTLTFRPTLGSAVATELYAYESLHYPQGINISVTPPGALRWQRLETNYFAFYANVGVSPHEQIVLTLEPLPFSQG